MPTPKRDVRARSEKEKRSGMFDPEHIGNINCQKKAGLERALAALVRLTPASMLDFI